MHTDEVTQMNFGDIFNLIEGLYRAAEQDPMSFMVVYPMTIMTSSMLIYALIQDYIPVYKNKLADAIVFQSRKAQPALQTVATTPKKNFKAGNQVRFSN
jgi:hypothetical protein